MPEISRFLGIIIAMYYNDHAPPHFHAKYGAYKMRVDIGTGSVISGEFPRRARKLTLEWCELYRDECSKTGDWQRNESRQEEFGHWSSVMTPQLIDAQHLGGYRLKLTFNDGTEGVVDFESELWGEVFDPLKDVELFRKFKVDLDLNTVVWDTGADFAPEFLYEKASAD